MKKTSTFKISLGFALCISIAMLISFSQKSDDSSITLMNGGHPNDREVILNNNTNAANLISTAEVGAMMMPMPSIGVVKSIDSIAPAITSGNYEVRLKYTVRNTGNRRLVKISLVDNLVSQWGSAFIGVLAAPTVSDPDDNIGNGNTADPNPDFNGGTMDSLIIGFDGELGRSMGVGKYIEVYVTVEVDISESPITGLMNQATATGTFILEEGQVVTETVVEDVSDDNTGSGISDDAFGGNPEGAGDIDTGFNDFTPLVIPSISISKEISKNTSAVSGTQGNVDVTFSLVIKNTGNDTLKNLTLLDDIAGQLGAAFVGLSGDAVQIISGTEEELPSLASAYTGAGEAIFTGTDGVLAMGQQFTVEITAEIDPDGNGVVDTLYNQASAAGIASNGAAISDLSDSGSDPDSTNADALGDTGGLDDKTPIAIPSISLAKSVQTYAFAQSGVPGNLEVTFEIVVKNTGNVTVDSISLLDTLSAAGNLGGAFVNTVGAPLIDQSSANTAPILNPGFDGTDVSISSANIFDGESGILEPCDSIKIVFTAEYDPGISLDSTMMFNQAHAVALDNGREISDASDSGTNPRTNNLDGETNTDAGAVGPDDPTPVSPCFNSCELSCIKQINVSINSTCTAAIKPSGVSTLIELACNNYYGLTLRDQSGTIIPDDTLRFSNVGQIIEYTLSEPICGNECMGKILVENKNPPVIQCASDTITCSDLIVLAAPVVTNNCGDIELVLIRRTVSDVSCDDPNLQTLITETWVAFDPTNPSSARRDTCVQTLSIEKFDISAIVGPAVTDTTLNCAGGVMPEPDSLGVPTLNGVALYSNNFEDCGIYVTFTDKKHVFGNGCSTGVQRTWTVQNWICGTDNDTTFTQLVSFVDTTGPVLSGIPMDMTVSTTGFDCEATVVVPAITAVDNCNTDDIRVDISYSSGYEVDQNGATITLPIGTDTITYVVYDICGNSTTASYSVTVRDLQQPITVCHALMTISLNTEGLGALSAETLDNGSMDECGPVTVQIRRPEDTLDFMDEVYFTCADAGPDPIMVELMVTDASGNFNRCMAQVEIVDKIPPVLVSVLPDITVSCNFPFSMDSLGVFGNVVNNADSVEAIVIVADSVNFSGPAQDGLILDNCSTADLTEVKGGNLDQCGNGTLTRTFTATSPNGEVTIMTQSITFVNPTPFVEADITWPADITLNSCTGGDALNPFNLPDSSAFPLFAQDNCDMASATYEDKLADHANGGNNAEGCMVIERTWFVSDWCQRVNNQFVIFDSVQLITLDDQQAPTFASCSDVTITGVDPDCGKEEVTITAAATDDCSSAEMLVYAYEIELMDSSTTITGVGNTVTDSFPIGTHKVTFTVTDACGNPATCMYNFTVINTVLPPPICDSTIVFLQPSEPDGPSVTVTPDMFDNGSVGKCGTPVKLSFSSDTTDVTKTYGCDDVGQQAIWLVVTDIYGNQDSCATFVIVQDTNSVSLCDPPVELSCCGTPNEYTGMAVVTCNVDFVNGQSRFDIVGKIFDTRDTESAVPGTDWSQTGTEIAPVNWTYDEIGPIFGVAIDENANVFLAQTDVYNITDTPTGSLDVSYEAGWIYKAAPPMFTAVPFVKLHNTGGPLNGIGNIAYDEINDQLYASNLENGKIYRISAAGDTVQTYDPWVADDGASGIVTLSEQIWGIGLNVFDGEQKLYFARVTGTTREIVSIDVTNGMLPVSGDPIVEVSNVPGILPRFTDIAFSRSGDKLLITERGLHSTERVTVPGTTTSILTAHAAKLLNYELNNGTWEQVLGPNDGKKFYVGSNIGLDGETSAGGVSFGFDAKSDSLYINCDSLVWVSGNVLNSTLLQQSQRIYGIQGINYSGNVSAEPFATGHRTTDIYWDLDGELGTNTDLDQKGSVGDVELFRCGNIVGGLIVDVDGTISTEDNVEISSAEVYLEGSDLRDITDADGHYSFGEMPTGGEYSVKPALNTDHSNGVTTLDLILIQRHILGIESLISPYKLISADVNNNGKVTSSDLLELRKLILGIYDEFPNNTSWRFVDAGHEFMDANDPWAQQIPETYDIYGLSSDMSVDFYGMKIGDINGSAEMGGSPINAEVRSVEEALVFSYDDMKISKGETVVVPFYGDRVNSVLGYQFTLNVDSRRGIIGEVVNVAGGFDQVNFGKRHLEAGYLTSSWNRTSGVEIDEEKPLFSIQISAMEDILLSDLIALSADIANSEAYTLDGELIDVELGLRNEKDDLIDGPELFQNQPNPWTMNTVIAFRLPARASATLRVFDVTGKLVTSHTRTYEAGTHKYELLDADFASRGMYYYELISGDYKLSKKMVLLK